MVLLHGIMLRMQNQILLAQVVVFINISNDTSFQNIVNWSISSKVKAKTRHSLLQAFQLERQVTTYINSIH